MTGPANTRDRWEKRDKVRRDRETQRDKRDTKRQRHREGHGDTERQRHILRQIRVEFWFWVKILHNLNQPLVVLSQPITSRCRDTRGV